MQKDARPIRDIAAYRQSLETAGERSQLRVGHLDRSDFFRYPQDIEVLQRELTKIDSTNNKARILEFGVGNLEEPLSYLAAMYRVLTDRGKSLRDSVDLTMVELRSRSDVTLKNRGIGKAYRDPRSKAEIGAAFIKPEDLPKYQAVPLPPRKGLEQSFQLSSASGEYEFHADILAFLQSNLDSPSHGRFDTPLENYLTENKDQFDIVTCNNVLQHLGGKDAYPTPIKNKFAPSSELVTFYNVVTSILDRVKPGGLLIMHTDGVNPGDTKGLLTDSVIQKIPFYKREFFKEGEGLYRRLTPEEVRQRFERSGSLRGKKTSIRTQEVRISQKDHAKIERIRGQFGEKNKIKKRLVESEQVPRFAELTKSQQETLLSSIDTSRLGRLPDTNLSRHQLDEFYTRIRKLPLMQRVQEGFKRMIGSREIHAQDLRQLAKEYNVDLLYYPGSDFDTVARDALGNEQVIHLSAEENRDSTPGYFEIKREEDLKSGVTGLDMNVVGDFRDSPFRDEVFDATLIKGIPTHFAVDSIDDIKRVMKEGGYIFFVNDGQRGSLYLRDRLTSSMKHVRTYKGIEVFQI